MLSVEKTRLEPDVTVLAVAGRISIGRSAQQLEWEMDELVKGNQNKVILDLAGVSHVDSTGIGIIVLCSGKLKAAGGELRVAGASGLVDQVLRLTKIDNIVRMFPTRADAAAGFAGHA